MLRFAILLVCIIGAFADAPKPILVNKYNFETPETPITGAKHVEYPIPAYAAPATAPYPAAVPIVKDAPYPAAVPVVKSAPYPAATPTVKVVKPHEVYGAPEVEEPKPVVPVLTKYTYDIPRTTPKPVVKIVAPYPAAVPIVKTAPYPAATPVVKVVKPHEVYGAPEVEEHKPAVPVLTKYTYDIPRTTPKPIVKVAPYPAAVPIVKSAPYPAATPIVKVVKPHEVYGAPEVEQPKPVVPVLTKYTYDIPRTTPKPIVKVAPYPAAVPVVKSAPYPAATPIIKVVKPHSVYGVPEVEQPKPVVPVLTKYTYDIPRTTPKPIVKVAPYPAATPIVKVVKPHSVYGIPEVEQPKPIVPVVPVQTKYTYDIPRTTTKPVVKVAPYPAPVKVVKPHDVYGVPEVKYVKPAVPVLTKYAYDIPKTTPKPAPYPAKVYGVPHEVYGPPAAAKIVVPEIKAVPVVSSYKYEIPVTTAAPKVVPHAIYGVPSLF